MNNEIYYNAALTGFLRGVYEARVVNMWKTLGRIEQLEAAQAYARTVDSLIPFDSQVTTSSTNPAQLAVGTSQDIAREQWRGALLESVAFASIAGTCPTSTDPADYIEVAQTTIAAWNSTKVALLASFAPTPPPPTTAFVVDNAPFTFASPSPILLLSINPGDILCAGAAIVITEDWLNPAARVQLGTPATANLFLDVSPIKKGQYTTPMVEEFSAADQLLLTLTGADTQGAGYVVFSYNR